ncbi:pyridoxamine 5'-phosphate oxidase family protein [Effusibacillus consociatus]|uniref:Pyridoxamine 5'-phosphate oxidase family protein n=1 Tax=Effusibacillus consociatus TaxID=1117041 RepID=A0ABV9Q7V7_9BACL
MAEKVVTELSQDLVNFLQGEKLVFLHTTDFETGAPNVAAISWLLAISPKVIRFAVDPRSRIVSNIKKDGRVSVAVLGPDSCYSISGVAKADTENLEGVALKMIKVEIAIDEVRDVMFYGAKLLAEPKYEKTYDPKLAEKYDTEVYTALKKG